MNSVVVDKKLNILFISLVIFKDLEKRGIYPDLINSFIRKGHHVTILSPIERRDKFNQDVINGKGYTILRYKTLNNTKTNFVEKLLSTLTTDWLMSRAIKRYVKTNIDFCICATPPVSLVKTVKHVKSKLKAPCYLLLKDIFPDNIVGLGLISKKSILYKYFRSVEVSLYKNVDFIGCMTPKNVEYILENNQYLSRSKIEICPNAILPIENKDTYQIKQTLRKKYNVNPDAKVFFYGGNLGIGQMIPYILEVLNANRKNNKVHFVLVGNGTEFKKIEKWFNEIRPNNTTLLTFLPKHEYDELISIADIGMVFLDNRYIIPNSPNRMLSYMENLMPVLIASDKVTDIGEIATLNNFGKWCESGDVDGFNNLLNEFCNMTNEEIRIFGKNGRDYLIKNYHVDDASQVILKHFL